MERKINFLSVCLLTLLFTLPLQSHAQAPSKAEYAKLKAKRSDTRDERKLQTLKETYPLFFKTKKVEVSDFPAPYKKKFGPVRNNVQVNRKGGRTVLKAGNTTLWGNTIYRSSWSQTEHEMGIWSYSASNPSSATLLFPTESNVDFAYGGGVQGEKYYGMSATVFWGMVFPYIFSVDIETGDVTSEYIDDPTLLATETCTDYATGTIYGVFYTANLDGFELGIVDYEARERTTIGTVSRSYVALGISSDGVIYGVAGDGNLYKIDKATAEETLVGATGLVVEGENGSYQQSGEIDQTDNTFYWAFVSPTADEFALYTIDLTSGVATKVGDFPESDEIVAMVMEPKLAESGAPAKATDLSLNFVGHSTTGSITFTLPNITYGGDQLTGSINYTVSGGVADVTGTASPGQTVTKELSANEGMCVFNVVLSNDFGNSPVAKISKWVGYDVPNPATEVALNLDSETGVAQVSWTAPSEGLHNGYMGELKYNVYRIESDGDPQLVSEAQQATTFTETLSTSDRIKSISYGIIVVNGTQQSQMTTSNYGAVGQALEVPYFEGFDSSGAASLYTIIDNDGDGKTWSWYNGQMYATYAAEGSPNCDDWLIAPPIKLKAGRAYEITLKVGAASANYPERFEVKLGNAPTPEAMNITVVEEQMITVGLTEFSNDNVTVGEDGVYYLAVHKTSDADMYNLYVDDISIDYGPVATAPAAVSNLTVTPGAQGAMEATLSFTTPSTAVNGNPLSSYITQIDVYRDKQLAKTESGNFNVASAVSIVDDNIETSGTHSYYVVCHNSNGNGSKSNVVSAFIGFDVPAVPEGRTADDRQSSLMFKWEKVGEIGTNGGYVDPNSVKYNLMNTDGRYITDTLATTENNYYELSLNTDEGEQELRSWALSAENSIGSSSAMAIPVYVGAPYTLPFKETGANQRLNYIWYYGGSSNNVALLWSDQASDGDGYGLELKNSGSGIEYGFTECGKVSLAGSTNPVLYFSYKTNNANATVYAVMPDGTRRLLQNLTASDEYVVQTINLSSLKNERYIRLEMYADFDGEGSFWFDDVNIIDMLEYNLTMSNVEAPRRVNLGETAEVKLTVQNIGQNEARNFVVKLSADGQEIFNQGVDVLSSMATTTLTAEYSPTIFDNAGDVVLKGEVVFSTDLDPDDNVNEAVISLVPPSYRMPRDLSVSFSDGNTATLNWLAPDFTTVDPITEGFDDEAVYEAFSVGGIAEGVKEGELGNWKLYDGDGYGTYSWQNMTYPNAYSPMAYQVFKASDVFDLGSYPEFAPRSDDNMLLSMCAALESGTAPSDDWLISPQLAGSAQTISFFYKVITADYGAEMFEVLYSSTGTSPEDFVSLQEFSATNESEWMEATVALPEGARFFAIRHYSEDAFGLFIDDITFTPAMASNGMRNAMSPTGYNVYVDREKVGDTTETHYTSSAITSGEHMFSVTAVYSDGGESMAVSVYATSIEEIFAEGKPVDIYSLDGILVKRNATDVEGVKPGIYVVGDKKVIVK